jgi:hypothetical protein
VTVDTPSQPLGYLEAALVGHQVLAGCGSVCDSNRFIAGMNLLCGNLQWTAKELLLTQRLLTQRVKDQLMGLMFNSNAPLPIFSVGDWWACVRVY